MPSIVSSSKEKPFSKKKELIYPQEGFGPQTIEGIRFPVTRASKVCWRLHNGYFGRSLGDAWNNP